MFNQTIRVVEWIDWFGMLMSASGFWLWWLGTSLAALGWPLAWETVRGGGGAVTLVGERLAARRSEMAGG